MNTQHDAGAKETPKEEVITTIDSKTPAQVACYNCGKEGMILGFFPYKGKDGKDVYLCPDCRDKVNAELAEQSKDISFGKALLFGIIAGILGGLVWYYFAIETGFTIGYIGIGLGYLVGLAVFHGAGKKKSVKLQILGVVIVILAILLVKYFLFNHFGNEYIQEHLSDFPDFTPGEYSYLDPNAAFWNTFLTPVGLFIYGFSVYVVYKFLKPLKA